MCYRKFWALYGGVNLFVTMVSESGYKLDVSSSNLGGTYSYHWGSPEFSKPPGAGFSRRAFVIGNSKLCMDWLTFS